MTEGAERDQRVADLKDRNPECVNFGRPRNDERRGAIANRVAQIVMAIEALASKSEERIPLPDLARVSGYARELRRSTRQLPDSLSRERRYNRIERPETRAQA
jgi:hypothetical protein